jgi:hypothetical protein
VKRIALTLFLALALAPALFLPASAAPLSKEQKKKIKQALGQAISKGEWATVGKELKALAAANDKKTWKLMVGVVEKSPPAAVLELVLADAAKSMTHPKVQAEVRKTAVKSKHARVRRVLMTQLGRQKDWKSLILAIKDKDEQTAAMAAWALIDNRVPAAVTPMIDRLAKLEKTKGGIWDVLYKGLGQMLGMRCNSAIEYRSRWDVVKSTGGLAKVEPAPASKSSGGTMVRVRLFDREIDCTRVVFIVDVSGSMIKKDAEQKDYEAAASGTRTKKGVGDTKLDENGEPANLLTRLQRAQRQLRKVIKQLPASFKINIVKYDGHVSMWRSFDGDKPAQLHALNAKNRKSAIDYVNTFKPGGVTDTGAALRRAYEVEGARCFYLLSDGKATINGRDKIPTPEIIAVMDEFKSQHVTVHTLGFKAEADVVMMKALAKHTGGKYSDIE